MVSEYWCVLVCARERQMEAGWERGGREKENTYECGQKPNK